MSGSCHHRQKRTRCRVAIWPGSLGTGEAEAGDSYVAEERLCSSNARQRQARIAAHIEILVA